MKRRDFIGKTGCGFAGMLSAPFWLHAEQEEEPEKKRRYKIEIEIYEAKEDYPHPDRLITTLNDRLKSGLQRFKKRIERYLLGGYKDYRRMKAGRIEIRRIGR